MDDGGETTNAEEFGKYSVINVEVEKSNSSGVKIEFSNELYEYLLQVIFQIRIRGRVLTDSVKVSSPLGEETMKKSAAKSRAEFFSGDNMGYVWVDEEHESVWYVLTGGLLPNREIRLTRSDN